MTVAVLYDHQDDRSWWISLTTRQRETLVIGVIRAAQNRKTRDWARQIFDQMRANPAFSPADDNLRCLRRWQ